MAAIAPVALPVVGDLPRRDFMGLLTLSGAAIGAGSVAWPFVDSMIPAKDTLAAGEPLDVDVRRVEPGQQIVVMWRGSPIFIGRRSPEAIKTLQDPTLTARLN